MNVASRTVLLLALTTTAFALTSAAALAVDRVERRGSEGAIEGSLLRMDDSGITLKTLTGAEHTVTWDRVRDAKLDHPEPRLNEYKDLSITLWRARSRLERGDNGLAEPLFERLFAQYRGRTHETALIVAEGLLRCRLARGANDTAVIPALEVARLRRKGLTTIAYHSFPPVIDEATSLCTRLPPAWAQTASLARLDDDLKTYDSGGDPALGAIAASYRAAIRQQLGLSFDVPPQLAQEHPGVTLMRMLIETSATDADRRAAARASLDKRLPELPAWAMAWARFAIGRSLLGESGVGRQQSGLVSLAYLPASFERDQPYLTSIALGMMVDALERSGDPQAASTLRGELDRLFPDQRGAAVRMIGPSSKKESS